MRAAGRQPADNGTPNTIVGIEEARMRVVHYFDDRGRATNEILLEIDGLLYTPPNSIEWCGALRQLSGKQLELIRTYDAKRVPTKLPEGDAVDVVSEEGASV